MKEKLKTKKTVISALRDEIQEFCMKQDEYNTKMKRMEKHVQDITAKEISNREAVLLLKDHMRNIDDMSMLEKEKMELEIDHLKQTNRILKHEIDTINHPEQTNEEDNEITNNDENIEFDKMSLQFQINIDKLNEDLKNEKCKNKTLKIKNYKTNEKYKNAVCKLRMYERRYEKLYMKNYIDNNNSVVMQENDSLNHDLFSGGDDNNNNNYNNTILRKEQPEEDGDASYDTSKKIRMLSDEKVRLAAALGKSRHKELLLKNKNRRAGGLLKHSFASDRRKMYVGANSHLNHRKLYNKNIL